MTNSSIRPPPDETPLTLEVADALHATGDPLTRETRAAESTPRSRHPFFRFTLAAMVLLLAAHGVVGWQVARLGSSTREFGWDASYGEGWRLVSVDARGPAAGLLQVGDRIAAVEGDRRLGPSLWLHLNPRQPSDSHRFTIARAGQELEVLVPAPVRAAPGLLVERVVPSLLVSLAFCLGGLLAGLGRPDLPAARRLAAGMLAAAAFDLYWAVGPLVALMPPFAYTVTLALSLFDPIEYALGYDFVARFPPGVAPRRPLRLIAAALYAWAAFLGLVEGVLTVTHLVDPRAAIGLDAALPALASTASWLSGPFYFVACAASISVAVYNFVRVKDPGQRRRARWLIAGIVAGLTPVVVEGVLLTIGRAGIQSQTLDRIGAGLALVEPWFVLLLPATLVYTVLAYRLLDIRVVVRRGVQHLLARSALTATLVSPVLPLAVDVALRPDRTILQVARDQPWLLGLASLALLGLAGRTRALALLDRLFFREAHDRERILHVLVDSVGNCASLGEVARLAAGQLEAAFHPTAASVLWRDAAGGLRLGYPAEAVIPPTAVRGSALLRRLEESPSSFWDAELERLAPVDRRWTGALGATLFVPLTDSGRRVSGLIALGPKRSEEPYAAEDRRLLQTVAAQIGLVGENLSLKGRVDEGDRTRRQVLAHLSENAGSLPIVECPTCGRVFESPAQRCADDGSRLSLLTPVERTLDQKYRLDRVLGRGGMGAVYEALDLRLQRPVAVKVLSGPAFDRPNAMRRFEREARVCARLRHPHIVTVYDYGSTQAAQGAYLVMERLRGMSLRSELQARPGPVAPAVVAGWVEPILDALQAAHAEGIVHRDLKPENVFLSLEPDGRQVLKVLDFGVAKVLGGDSDGEPQLTLPGSVLGTLAYMSPEQIEGRAVDHRTDLFALGMITAECVLGEHPFGAHDMHELVAALVGASFHLPGDAPEVTALDRVIGRCVAKAPDDRHASAEELRAELLPALRACPVLAIPS